MTVQFKKFLGSIILSTLFIQACNFDNDTIQNEHFVQPDYYEFSDQAIELMNDSTYGGYFIDSSSTSLYIIPYTDNTITTAILTKNITTELSNLFNNEGIRLNKTGIPIDFLKSKKGIHLGVEKKTFLNLFNLPDSSSSEDKHEINYWHFKMKESARDTFGLYRPFVMNGLGFNIKAIFTKDSLSHLEYTYEVP